MSLFGRRQIFTISEITEKNVVSELNKALSVHSVNLLDEEYLYWYRRGMQPILQRTKEIRPEICNKVVINNADQIVTFKNGYFMTSPASYSARKEESQDKVREFNEICVQASKSIADNEVIDWFHTVGLGVLYVEPNKDDKPLNIYSLDPRSAFVVYSFKPGNPPVMGVNMVIQDDKAYYDVFTKDYCYHIEGGVLSKDITDQPITASAITLVGYEPNIIGEIPIIEYQYNKNRMGAFEVAIPIMDEINTIESNRADGVEQTVQQLCIAYNCNFEDGTTANSIRQAGMICLRSMGENKADFKILESSLSQADTQTSLDALYNQLLDKTGLPNVSRSDSGGDNGSAVYLKSGYTIADTNRRNTEDYWRKSDEQFRKVALAILKKKGFELSLEDMELNIEPPTMSNLLVKTQAAMNMRELGLAPEIWLERSGISNDPLSDIEMSKEYIYKFYENKKLPQVINGMNEDEQVGEALADEDQMEEVPTIENE